MSGPGATRGTEVYAKALDSASKKVSDRICEVVPDQGRNNSPGPGTAVSSPVTIEKTRILVTADRDLLSKSIGLLEVRAALEQINIATVALQSEVDLFRGKGRDLAPDPLSAVLSIGQVAGLIFSLFKTDRTLTTYAGSSDVNSTHASVMSALLSHTDRPFVTSSDQFRPIPESGVVAAAVAAKAALEKLASDASKLGVGEDKPTESKAAATTELIAKVMLVVGKAKEALMSMSTAPDASSNSPLVVAALAEEISPTGASIAGSGYHYVLFVPASIGSIENMNVDRKVGQDWEAISASAQVTFMLLEVSTGLVVAAGVETGTASLRVGLGSELEFGDVRVGV